MHVNSTPAAKLKTTTSALTLEAVSKSYASQAGNVEALKKVSCTFPEGQMTAIMGPSGSGKSTLLQCAAGLDIPTTGKILLGEDDLATMDEERLGKIRRERLGFIFQAFNLVPMLNVSDNIALPMQLAGRVVAKGDIELVLEQVGLRGLGHRYPAELSGGQQQRTAIARTLISHPDVLFADEPTGALDVETGKQILGLLRSAVDSTNQTVIMVTHDPLAAATADRVLYLVDGQIQGELERPTLDDILRQISMWRKA